MKRGKILAFVLVLSLIALLPLFSQLILAGEAEMVGDAYGWLASEVDSKGCNTLSTTQKIFTILSIDTCLEELKQSIKQEGCFGATPTATTCTVEDTAKAMFALSSKGEDFSAPKQWLLNPTHNKISKDLKWFLQVDASPGTECVAKYDYSGDYSIFRFSINEDRTLKTDSGNAGPCLGVVTANSPYWFTISEDCYDKEMVIICNNAFRTNLLFKTEGDSQTLYVLDNTNSKSGDQSSLIKTNAKCFTLTGKQTGSCDYSSTLWASFALWASGDKTSSEAYLPYLVAMKEEGNNPASFPESFLYMMTGKTSFYQELTKLMVDYSYWNVGNGKFYDTGLALWALNGQGIGDYAVDYLLRNQEEDGSWNDGSIRDTALILFAVWYDSAPECFNDENCQTEQEPYLRCDTAVYECYNPAACDKDEDCTGDYDGFFCSPRSVCLECFNDNHCQTNQNSNRRCNTTIYECYNVECLDDEDCKSKDNGFCSNKGICHYLECLGDEDCQTREHPDWLCNANNVCYDPIICATDEDCKAISSAWVCGSEGICVECETNFDCQEEHPGWACHNTWNYCYDPFNPHECYVNEQCQEIHPGWICNSDNVCAECEEHYHCNLLAGEICSNTGVCYIPGEPKCGNGIRESVEQCDGTNLNNKICSDIIPDSKGSLSCIPMGETNECLFDTSGCYECLDNLDCDEGVCNSKGVCVGCVDDEDCNTLSGEVCSSQGVCYIPQREPECGNFIKEEGEECDGTDLGDKGCGDIISGYMGSLGCTSPGGNNECKFDTSECYDPTRCSIDDDCGNDYPICTSEGICVECEKNSDCQDRHPGWACHNTWNYCYDPFNPLECYVDEQCDDETHPGWVCTSENVCAECVNHDDCDTSIGEICSNTGVCYIPGEPKCGNGIKEDVEECDGFDLNDKECGDIIPNWKGSLGCTSPGGKNECKFDTIGCYECRYDLDCPEGVCNSDKICVECETNSDCNTFSGEVCSSQGVCYIPPASECGNGVFEPGEQCDGTNLNGKTCGNIIPGYIGSLSCIPPGGNNECEFDTEGCYQEIECGPDDPCPGDQFCSSDGYCVNQEPECGNGIKEDGEQCDGEDFNGVTCESLELGSGELGCEDCIMITSSCEDEVECDTNWECTWIYGSGYECIRGECVPEIENCTDNEDCPGGECVEGDCVYQECTEDEDCPGEDICINGSCFVKEIECDYDWDCTWIYGSGYECIGGECKSKNLPPDECETSFDCNLDEICIDGICSNEEEYDCEEKGYFCMSTSQCIGEILEAYSSSCQYPYKCCTEPLPLNTCFEEDGEVCLSDEKCIGGKELNTSDLKEGEVCCAGGGDCIEKTLLRTCEMDNECDDDEECISGYCKTSSSSFDCEANGGTCRPTDCKENEKTSYEYTCDYEDTCCMEKDNPPSGGIWLIVILLILIALVVSGIIFRDKLRVYWLKVKSKFGKGKSGKPPYGGRPGMPPLGNIHGKPTKKNLWEKIKGFFTGKKQKPLERRNIPPRPLRGPLAVQHAQRQAQQTTAHGRREPPIKPSPSKPTTTPFSQQKPADKTIKKPEKKTTGELDEVLEKLKKMGK
jgi:hypothetical protein